MQRGELYRVRHPAGDPKRTRVYVIVSRSALATMQFDSMVCAPVFSKRRGIATELPVGQPEGLRHESAVCCDALMSIHKHKLSDYVGSLAADKLRELDRALRIALALT
jgi:mRNA interferase MazF